jgi:trk system potassium uptake protein TrkH
MHFLCRRAFTSTSAVCVTGLIVVDTATEFTVSSKKWQYGAHSIRRAGDHDFYQSGSSRCLPTAFRSGGGLPFRICKVISRHIPDTKPLKRIVFNTFTFEGTIAVILFTQFYPSIPFWKSAEHSVFLSVSAFCNAGFSTFSDNLATYRANSIVVIAIAVDVMLGTGSDSLCCMS